MTRIVSAIVIHAPLERIFDYVTTPANWPRWHPASLAVSEGADHSLEPGERVTEDFQAAGRAGRAVWTVRERAPPHRWVIDGTSEGGGGATITYRLTPEGGAVRFERELVYHMPNLTLAFLNIVVIRRRMTAESAEALRRLKSLLEAG